MRATIPVVASAANAEGSDLAAERVLLDLARSNAAHGEPAQVLEQVAQHRRQFPHGRLVEEREALAIRALLALGRTDEARAHADAFRAAHPRSSFGSPNPAPCSAVAVHGDYVYWLGQSDTIATSLALRRTPIDGSGTPQVLADDLRIVANNYVYGSPEFEAHNLAFESDFIYWSQGSLYGSIVRCPLSGCVGAPEVVAEPVRAPTTLLMDGHSLYFQHDTSNRGSAISCVTLPDGAPSEPLAYGIEAESALATDDRYLYTATTDVPLSADGVWLDPWASIRRIPKTTEAQ